MSGTLDERLFCAFKAFDEDGNGNLDVHEVAKLLQASGFSLETALMGAQDVFKNADKDGNGLLSFDVRQPCATVLLLMFRVANHHALFVCHRSSKRQ